MTRTFGDYTTGLMLGAAFLLGVSIVLYNLADRRVASRGTGGDPVDIEEQAARKKDQAAPLSKEGGFKLLLSSKYLLLIAALILVSNLVNTNGEFIVSNAARTESEARFPDDAFTARWVDAIESGAAERPYSAGRACLAPPLSGLVCCLDAGDTVQSTGGPRRCGSPFQS